MDNLTPKRRAIFEFIRERIAEHGQPPSLADIATRFGFASRSVARKHITALCQAGYIDVTPNQARGIRLAEPLRRPEILEMPVLGQVAQAPPSAPTSTSTSSCCSTPACSAVPLTTCSRCVATR
jgi:repressor LexA